MIEPLYEELPLSNVDDLITLFSDKKDLMVLSSTMQMEGYGRYSFICFDSFWSFSCKDEWVASTDTSEPRLLRSGAHGTTPLINSRGSDTPDETMTETRECSHDPFDVIHKKMNEYPIKKIDHLPPLQGGLVGYFGYEASHYLEKLPDIVDNINLPDIYLNAYSCVISIDHATNQCWVVATGFPEKSEPARVKKAQKDIRDIKCRLGLGPTKASHNDRCSAKPQPTSNFTQDSYINAVNITKKYILNGDIFQANISQQFNAKLPPNYNPLDLYFNLMSINPAPFSAFITLPGQGYILSASPERFVKLTDQLVETCPIKGTRKRSSDPVTDQRLAAELSACEKDHAENVMIVDLMRNDISKVCQHVNVEELCALKSFETVHHLVSKVTGVLKNNQTAIDLMKATFPPGSVTGAPKIRAMEIISELEKLARGPYCGCLGYLSFTGDMDMSVIIRTYFIHQNNLFFSAGGAIVLDSDPAGEYQESLIKAFALIKALTI